MGRPIRFRARRRRRPSRGLRWTLVALALIAAGLALQTRFAPPEQQSEVASRFGYCSEGWGACVIDGDTLAIGQRRVRLTGYDAPELDGACEAERAKAVEAREALHAWLARGRFSWTGGTEPPRDQYGRELREARRGDEVLADHMVGAGLAEASGWGAERIAWC